MRGLVAGKARSRFAGQAPGQDTRDTQDTQDGALIVLRACNFPANWQALRTRYLPVHWQRFAPAIC